MKRILVTYEVSEEKWKIMCSKLQNLLDNGNSEIRVAEYQTYEENEQYPDIMKRKEVI